ncbi:MAG TPA: methionine adenosyltransferase, partial [Dissulfurispiraceae bacterium]
ETGEDIKIMGLRSERDLDLTVAMPFLAHSVRSEAEYFERKGVALAEMMAFLEKFEVFKRTKVHFNTLDAPGRGLGGVYLTLLGTSAENADSGQVGRGNRVNGIISVNRPMGTEAAAGKNPVSHVGKVYNVLSHKIAKEIYEGIEGIKEVYVFLLSRIGTPIDSPHMATARIMPERGRKVSEIAKDAAAIFEKELAGIGRFCTELSRGRYTVC